MQGNVTEATVANLLRKLLASVYNSEGKHEWMSYLLGGYQDIRVICLYSVLFVRLHRGMRVVGQHGP